MKVKTFLYKNSGRRASKDGYLTYDLINDRDLRDFVKKFGPNLNIIMKPDWVNNCSRDKLMHYAYKIVERSNENDGHGPMRIIYTRQEMIEKLKELGAKEVNRSVIDDKDPELLEVVDCLHFMRFVFFEDEVRYLPDGEEPHPVQSDEWKDLSDEDIQILFDYDY